MDITLAVGGAFLSSFLGVAFDRIASSRMFLDLIHQKQHTEFDEETLDTLETTLMSLSVVLNDAEAKQAKSKQVETWLNKLETTMHQADDLLDELNTEYLILEVHHQFHLTDANLALKSDFIQEFTPSLKKITARLENFVKQSHVLGLQKCDPTDKGPYRAPSSSVVDKSRVFCRNYEKEEFIKRVLSDGEGASDVSVIAITGMGGIGKTTLAQHVYDDERVKKKFTTRAWVCVSEEYDARKITQALLMEVNSDVVDKKDDFNRLQVKLRENIGEKCFLIILDDIWNKNFSDWESLKSPLHHGSRGSKIIVTTRDENVASMMQNEPFHHLQPIPEDQSWSLFKSYAFDNGDQTLLVEFENIGKEIVRKCKGLPLAIKTVAGALRLKRDINVWNSILSSEIWGSRGDILPALSLSYIHLPSHLKPCFAFCALFPKDIPFERDEVVLLWMANDLAASQKDGCDYFDELKSRSLFEMVNGEKYLMHDLVNDLARSISRKSCIRLEDYEAARLQQSVQREKTIPPEILHFSYQATYEDASGKFSALAKAQNLRTFIAMAILPDFIGSFRLTTSFFSDILPRFHRIRSLSLSGYGILVVPDSIGDLKHLRFLNLAQNHIKKLPNTICKCMNLQTLILSQCYALEELPQDMKYLINLLHLDVRGVGNRFIRRLDSWMGVLKDIQNLSILVDRIHASALEQLGKLQLFESLVISGLKYDVTVARAKLRNKEGIKKLTLEWNGIAECSEDVLNIFSKLKPPTSMKKLKIREYPGTRFPDWLGDPAFGNLECLCLIDCKNCYSLPPLGQLAALKKVSIDGMDGITDISETLYGNSIRNHHLDKLYLRGCSDLVSIPNHVDKLIIMDCPSLSLSLQSSVIKKLQVVRCKNLEYPTSDSCNPYIESLTIGYGMDSIEGFPICSFPKLEYLYIYGWDTPQLFKFPNGYHQSLTALKSLFIQGCNNILCFQEGGLPAPNLRRFRIELCKKLKSLPEQMHTQLSSLEDLLIIDCPEIECFPDGGLPSSLKTLYIRNCEKLMISKRNWDLQNVSSLKRLTIEGFPDEMLLPSNLKNLAFCKCPNMESLNLKGLQHVDSLQSLEISSCRNLKSLNGVQHLPSLQSLKISSCPNLRCFVEEKLSSSLSYLQIHSCENLESLPVSFTSSLSTLDINTCPKLEARIEKGKGEDWPKVSYIPYIYVGKKLIS